MAFLLFPVDQLQQFHLLLEDQKKKKALFFRQNHSNSMPGIRSEEDMSGWCKRSVDYVTVCATSHTQSPWLSYPQAHATDYIMCSHPEPAAEQNKGALPAETQQQRGSAFVFVHVPVKDRNVFKCSTAIPCPPLYSDVHHRSGGHSNLPSG